MYYDQLGDIMATGENLPKLVCRMFEHNHEFQSLTPKNAGLKYN